VQLETDGLHVALQQLAASVSTRFGVDCQANCDESLVVAQNVLATHLYRIAQEAVNNAVKHAKPKKIVIHLKSVSGHIELSVVDDGIGIPLPLGTRNGMGLHTMEYRARMIGGILEISRPPSGGTLVSCRVPQPRS
jgi:signal transduction histidine kinase